MDGSSKHPEAAAVAAARDDVSVLRWFAAYAAALITAALVLAWLGGRHDWQVGSWWRDGLGLRQRWDRFLDVFAAASPLVKLIGFAIYISLCTTFLPLPTGGLVAALATREAALAAGLDASLATQAAVTTLSVALIGAAASTVANLNDYHLFTWMLRSDRVQKVRHSRAVQRAERWFARSPLLLLVVFNILPIPIDVVRILAISYRYPRRRFALANFAGRFIRYGVIAFVTFWWNLGWIAVACLLGLGLAIALGRMALGLVRTLRPANAHARRVS